MKNRVMTGILMMVVLAMFPVLALAGDQPEPTAAEQVKGLEGMCEASAEARTARQEAKPLYDRLGGYEKILALTNEIVRLHQENPDFRLMMKYVDSEHLAKQVADFMASGTGGTATYKGRNMKAAHAHLEMTNADFLSAGGDVIKAMKNLGYGQDEIDEVVCILVSFVDQVIYE